MGQTIVALVFSEGLGVLLNLQKYRGNADSRKGSLHTSIYPLARVRDPLPNQEYRRKTKTTSPTSHKLSMKGTVACTTSRKISIATRMKLKERIV